MNRKAEQSEPGRIDRILASEEELAPTSGFLAAVMERVEEEAAAPAPIPFPWKRALPGMVLAAGVFGWGAWALVRGGLAAGTAGPVKLPDLSAALWLPLEQAGWVALALSISLVSWLLARRLAGRAELL